jgi:hypothetical protein
MIDVNQLLTWCRIANNRRDAVSAELMPGGLEDLEQYSLEEVREAIKGFRTMPTEGERFSISALSAKRIAQLTLCEQNMGITGLQE